MTMTMLAAMAFATTTGVVDPTPANASPPPERTTYFEPGLGYMGGLDRETAYAMVLDASVYHTFGAFAFGGTTAFGMELFGRSVVSVGAVAGVSSFVTDHLRVSLLGELGVHAYAGIGSSLFSEGDGRASMGYGGGRAQVGWHFGRSRRVSLALALVVRDDFERKTVAYTAKGGLFCDGPCLHQGTSPAGEATLGLILQLGVAW